ncbi:MAG: MOSC domain-containing protein [Tissierellia bacterium]|nr:MOSC domain-containing protein [Tissierellia bacterium]
MAKVVSINISDKKGVIKTPIKEGLFLEHFGLEGDAHGGDWHRQVSLLAQESIDRMKKDLPHLKEGDFAENITTQGIVLYDLKIGTILELGQVLLKVSQIGKECHQGCAIKQQVGKCVMPKEGIFATVERAGIIKAGDKIKILES